MWWKEIGSSEVDRQAAGVPRPVGVVDGGAAGQPRRPPAVGPRGHDDVSTAGEHGEVLPRRATRRNYGDVDSVTQRRRRQVFQVLTTPADVVAGDDELNARESIDEVAHRAREVPRVRRRVAEIHFVRVEDVASTNVDPHAHVTALEPARRPRPGQKLVREPTNFRTECEVSAQPALDAACVLPTLEVSGQ